MKRFSRFLTAAMIGIAALFAYSCQDGNTTDEFKVIPDKVNLTAAHVTVNGDGTLEIDPIRINVRSTYEWQVQSAAEWITVSNIKTSGNDIGFDINVEVLGEDATESRSGIVLVTTQIGEIPVTVNQEPYKGNDEPEEDPEYAFEDYVGDYAVWAEMENMAVDSKGNPVPLPDYVPNPLEEIAYMYDMSVDLPNLLRLNRLMQYDGSIYYLDFVYDEETQGLYYRPYDASFYLTYLGYKDDPSDPLTTFTYLEEGAVYVKFNKDLELQIPRTINISGEDRTIYYLAYSPTMQAIFSYQAMYHITLTKF